MTINQDSIISELKLRVKFLEKQNEQWAGQMEEKLLLWLVTVTIKESNDPEELLTNLLERISVLLDIQTSACCSISDHQLQNLSFYSVSAKSMHQACGMTFSPVLIERLNEGPLFIDKKDFGTYELGFARELDTLPQNLALFPFQSIYIPSGVFIFLGFEHGTSVLQPLSMVIRHLIGMAVEKLDKLSLTRELKELNYSFETKLEERIREITDPKQNLQHQKEEKTDDTPVTLQSKPTLPVEDSPNINVEFLKNIGIEIRSPVNGILGFAELLRDMNLTDVQRNNYIDIIKSCGKSMMKIMEEVIDYAYIESDQLKINKSEFLLTEFLTEIYDYFKVDELFRQRKNIELKLNININGNSVIYSDRERLKQVMISLIGNSVKFTGEGFIEFGCFIRNTEEGHDRNELLFFVKDSGVGISAEAGDKIFDPFYKIEHEISRLYGGMGLGLTIARDLIKHLGGKIWFDSEINKGSEFYFVLPEAISSIVKDDGGTVSVQSNEFDWKDKLFLIVEDDQMSYLYLKEILKSTGASFLYVKDGLQAVDMVKEKPDIDLILMDIKLPGMNGYEATSEIKKIRNIPVIAQTAYAMADDQKKSLEVGCDGYVSKPINRKKLLQIISSLLSGQDQETAK